MHQFWIETKLGPRALALAGMFLLMLGSCSQNVEYLDSDETLPPPPPLPREDELTGTDLISASRSGRDPGLREAIPPGVRGIVSITPELTAEVGADAALYLIAHAPDGSSRAARRFESPSFPLTFFLGQESVMFAAHPLEGEVTILARIAQTGSAGPAQSGDLGGSSASVQVGDTDLVEVLIDTRR